MSASASPEFSPRATPWWAWPSALCLEGAAFVLFAREVVQPGAFLGRPWESAALAWVLWVGYVLERWLDARRGFVKGPTYRHAFVYRYAWALGVVALVALAGLLLLSSPDFALVAEALAKYRSAAFLAPLFLILNAYCAPSSGWIYRAVAVALILTLLAAKQSVVGLEIQGVQHVLYPGFALPIFALALANLAVTRRNEQPDRPWQLRLGPMLAAVVGMVFGFLAPSPSTGPALAAAFGGAGLWFLDRRSEGVPAEMVRARADFITALALCAALYLR